jgi:hypothetical protein
MVSFLRRKRRRGKALRKNSKTTPLINETDKRQQTKVEEHITEAPN